MLEASFARLSDGVTRYELRGKGPLLVLCAGTLASLETWFKVRAQIRGCTTLVYDYYGRGQSRAYASLNVSGVYPICLTLKSYIKQLRELLVALGIHERLCVIAGHSIGGKLCVEYARRYPQYVKGVCLINAAINTPKPPLPLKMKIISEIPYIREWYGQAYLRDAYKAFIRACYSYPECAPIREHLLELYDQIDNNARFYASILSSQVHCINRSHESNFENLCHNRVPFLFLWGDSDAFYPFYDCERYSEYARSKNCHTTVVRLKGGHHCCFAADVPQHTRIVAESLKAFASKLSRATIA